ncbi:hypothetical protein [Shewanella pneumatophori]|uniref:Uncharacterized protein n=1 Tax=Shewanella pneumatophori TaxID=314092 RepID=A0A9X1ZD25_9GAMM|nr:hypothetical protein [Shewanella pneumatophori]MCL1140009.1 hypothetical protein [Shewanella pneumatophori]
MPEGIRVISKKCLSESFGCNEYLSEFEGGYFHEDSCLQLILPLSMATVNPEFQHLVIGHAGTDGIEFCYRAHFPDIWAFYPSESAYQKVASSIGQLIQGWVNGSISV